jgi:hypothetical protein
MQSDPFVNNVDVDAVGERHAGDRLLGITAFRDAERDFLEVTDEKFFLKFEGTSEEFPAKLALPKVRPERGSPCIQRPTKLSFDMRMFHLLLPLRILLAQRHIQPRQPAEQRTA